MNVHLFEDEANEWRWRAVSRNGKNWATSEGYTRRRDALRSARKFFFTVPSKLVDENGKVLPWVP
jgi:uncharacterized protein YegP (UPF0339 family)